MDRHTAQRILSQVRREKQAADPVSVVQQAATQTLKRDALMDVLKVALGGAGLGVAARGAVGLGALVNRNLKKPKSTRNLAVVPMPLPATSAEDEPALKAASVASFLSGDQATSKEGLPWYKPALMLGGVGAALGGWKGIDAILKYRRKKETESEVTRAKSEFERALLGQYDQPKIKLAADGSLATDLDRLYDQFEKVAAFISPDTAGSLVGGYGTYAVPAALIAGYAAYAAGKKRQRRELIDKALKARMRRHQMQQPAELYAVPKLVPPVSAESKAAPSGADDAGY